MKKARYRNFEELKLQNGREQRHKCCLATQSGITLVALVVTIVVLLILAGITITYVFSDNGILSQAQSAANKTDVATVLEEIQSKLLARQLANTDTWTYSNTDVIEVIEEVAGVTVDEWDDDFTTENGNTVTISSLWVGEKVYDSNQGVNIPKLTSEMTPIKYDSTANDSEGGWVKTTADDEDWYSYTTTDKQWANVVIGGKFDANGVLDEDATGYTMWVWIPRYAYSIAEGNYHTSTAGTINIKFMVGTTDVAADGTSTWDNESGADNWNIHPAFEYGETVTGLWVAKFEASNINCTTTASTGSDGTTDSTLLQVKAGVTSWRYITIGDMYSICLAYGSNISNTSVNSHMMKNDEWGAVAYLAQSEYGKNSEIWINPNSSYITGQAGTSVSASSTTTTYSYTDTTYGVNASSTGNVYGIYDLSGGAYEYVAAYLNNGNANLESNGYALVHGDVKTKNVYDYDSTDEAYGYNNYTVNESKFGDAIYETSAGAYTGTSGTQYQSWNYDFSYFRWGTYTFFLRGGDFSDSSYAGSFGFHGGAGYAGTNYSFRPVLAIT